MGKSNKKIQWPAPRTVALKEGQQSTGGILYRVKTPDGKIYPFNNQEAADAFINKTLQENPTYYSDSTDNNASNNKNTSQRKDSSPKTSNQKPITQQSTQQQETPTQPSQPTSNSVLKNLSFTYNTPEWVRPFNQWTNENIPWLNKGMTSFGNFVNDEILLNKDNIRAKNAHDNPEIMDKIQEGGNIAGYSILAAAGLPALTEAVVASAPTIMNGLNIVGQFMTPSTWIGGITSAAGYQAPSWILNGADLAASLYFANEAGKEISKNGLNLKTGTNALLSLSPMTRSPKAAEAVAYSLRNPSQVINSVADDFRVARNAFSSPEAALGRELSRSIKNTKFTNVPVEHVSLNGMTKDSALDVGKEGTHLSPVGSYTTPQIETYFLNQGKVPFVRTGTWTYSTNTKPVEVQDVGYFGRGFNPDFDTKVDNRVTNFFYTNNFEGKGNTSYLTMRPSQGLQLSKNKKVIHDDRHLSEPSEIVPEGLKLPDGTYTPKMEDSSKLFADLKEYFQDFKTGTDPSDGYSYIIFNQNGVEYQVGRYSRDPNTWYVLNPQNEKWRSFSKDGGFNDPLLSAKQYILKLRDDQIKELDYPAQLMVKRSKIVPEKKDAITNNIDIEGTEIGNQMMKSIQNDIDKFYLSPEYIDRVMRNIGGVKKREDVIAQIKRDLQETKNKTKPVLYKAGIHNLGTSWSSKNSGKLQLFAGINSHQSNTNLKDWDSTLFHEFGHDIWQDVTSFSNDIKNYNSKLVYDNFTPLDLTNNAFKPEFKDYVKYLRDPDEFRQRIMEGVRYGIKEGLTPEEIYQQCKASGFAVLKDFFKKDYIIKMLGLMLGTTPVIINTKTNDRTS